VSERTILIVALCTGVVLACALSGIVGYQIHPDVQEAVQAAPGRTISVPVDGKMVEFPAGSEVVIETDTLEEAYELARSVTEAAASKGSGVEETGSAIKGTWRQEAPTASTSSSGGTGGALKASWSALSEISVTSILAVIGGLAMIAGAVLFVKVGKGLGLAVFTGGLIVAASAFLWQQYPLAVGVCGLLALVALGYLLYKAVKGKSIAESLADGQAALKAIVAGVDNAPAEAKVAVTDEVKKAAVATGKLATVKAVVAKVKK